MHSKAETEWLRYWGHEEKRATEDEIVGGHHQLNEYEFEQIQGDSGGQESLAWYSPWSQTVRRNWVTEQQKPQYDKLKTRSEQTGSQSFLASGSFPNELALCIRWSKHQSFSFSISPCNGYSGLISFRIDWFDLPAVQGTLKSSPVPQFKSFSYLALSLLYDPSLTSVHNYMIHYWYYVYNK